VRGSSLNGKPKATAWRSRDLPSDAVAFGLPSDAVAFGLPLNDLPSDAVAFGLPLNELVAAVPR
jgi:hypothetical protein